MQQKYKKEINEQLAIQWLKIAVGIVFISIAAYRFLSHGYDWSAVSVNFAFILFGVIIPSVAIAKVISLNREKRKIREENTWQEAEVC